MLPEKKLNIYPKSKENLVALIIFYFSDHVIHLGNALELMQKSNLTLNQFEFIIKKLSEAYISIFKQHLKGQIKLDNLIRCGVDALENEIPYSNGSKNRQLITKEFMNFVAETN